MIPSSFVRVLLVGTLQSVLMGCAAAPLYSLSLEPLGGHLEMDSAKAMGDSTRPPSEIQAGFLGQRQGAMELSLRIANRSETGLEVEPRNFSGTVRWVDTAGVVNRTPVHILDRNGVIQQVAFRKTQVEAAENPYKETGWDSFGGFLDASAGLASAFSGGAKSEEDKRLEKERRERQEEREERRRKAAGFENERIQTSAALGAEMTHLQQNLWSSTSLKPGEAVEKNLLVESLLEGDTVELVLPLGAVKHRLLFKQHRTRIR